MIDFDKIDRKYGTKIHRRLDEIYKFNMYFAQTYFADKFKLELADYVDYLSLDFIGVQDEYRGTGVASEFMETLCSLADELDYKYIKLDTCDRFGLEHEYLRKFYSKFGFFNDTLDKTEMIRINSNVASTLYPVDVEWCSKIIGFLMVCIPVAIQNDIIEYSQEEKELAEWLEIHAELSVYLLGISAQITLHGSKLEMSGVEYYKMLKKFSFALNHYSFYGESCGGVVELFNQAEAEQYVETELTKLMGQPY